MDTSYQRLTNENEALLKKNKRLTALLNIEKKRKLISTIMKQLVKNVEAGELFDKNLFFLSFLYILNHHLP